MKATSKKRFAKSSIELLEEAVHLLRMAPVHTTITYYIGAVPFVLGLLFFWADMSRSAFAEQHCASSSLVVVLLFVWMKTWQSVFASQLRRQLGQDEKARWSLRRFARTMQMQTVVHGVGLFVLPAALLIALPFGWVYAFIQNATVFGDADCGELSTLYKRAAVQSKLWQNQNHVLLSVLGLFGFFVFLNAVIAIIEAPALLKTLLGIETTFSRSGWWSIANTTFLATAIALTYLCIDPLIKAVYVLRCFYGESLVTADDLRFELRAAKAGSGAKSATGMKIALCIAGVWLGTSVSQAEESTTLTRPSASVQPAVKVSSMDLDRSINKVLSKREFTWRLPREKSAAVSETRKGSFELFIEGIIETLGNAARAVRDWVRDLIDWLVKMFGSKHAEERTKSSSSGGWMITLQVFVFILLAAVASAVAILLFRVWRQRRRKSAVMVAQAVTTKPDVADENVTANELPENEWIKLARELMEQGNLRLALRALYLGNLAHLADRELITVAKFKSNRDYETELSRRARPKADLQDAFRQNVNVFERVWYGMHEVTGEALTQFQQNCERIRTC